jgi:hypothetical protein
MIWFACKLCGKKQSRPDDQAGSLVFCTCGQANRVPWETEAGAEEAPQAFPKVWLDTSSPPAPAPRSLQEPLRRPLSPGYCFNHVHAPSTQSCSACLIEFCDNCIVKLGDQYLCGPCKNFRVLSLTRPARPSVLSVVCLALGLAGGPVAGCLTLWGVGPAAGSMGLALIILAFVLPVVTLVLGIKAISDMGSNRRIGGRGMAIIGIMSGIAGVLWCITVAGILAYHLAGG